MQLAVGLAVLPVTMREMSSQLDNGQTARFNLFGGSSHLLGLTIALVLLQIALDFVFNPVLTARFGGTPGKLICGLRVIRRNGDRVDLTTATRRWSPYLVLRVLSAVPIVGLLGSLGIFIYAVVNLVMIFANDRRVDVNDMIANTYVVTKA